ncbi:heme ABC transporter ATP-binding protein [Aestuariibius insulae]|uniref:heme ABC transporter ATP-binding protein n=1 Tax=Aestuariibius insulae TaxID=2058287 RepID=UPI00345EC4DA
MLEVQNLTATLNGKTVLKGITAQAKPGEITVIVGPNGSGKTTLLRALSGDLPYSGVATLNGDDIAAADPAKLAGLRAVLPQTTPLAFPFTAAEVVGLGARAGIGAADLTIPALALAAVDLGGYGGHFYQQLSGGEQQRVQLARALAQVWHPVLDGVPRWLFLDEPVSSLDLGHQILVMKLAKQFAASSGGVITVLHDLNLAGLFASQVLLLSNGSLQAAGSADEVFKDQTIEDVYRCRVVTRQPPLADTFFLLPHAVELM